MEISEMLLTYRAKNDLTQEELAKKLGITQVWLCNLESGRHKASKVLEMKMKMLMEEV
jgi:transcriptional regulator with XRE-family HTH domain